LAFSPFVVADITLRPLPAGFQTDYSLPPVYSQASLHLFVTTQFDQV
jgi:hypothetical protein